MNVITSKDNDNIKKIKKLKEKKYRKQEGKYIIEASKLIEEAIKENAKIEQIIVCEDCITEATNSNLLYEIAKYDCIYVSEKVFKTLTDVSTPRGMLAVIKKKDNKKEVNYNEDMIVILDGVQDPGNMGTILRTIDSAGLSQVIVTKEVVDAYSPKVVRSTMGAIFRVNIIETEDKLKMIKEIKKHKFNVAATSLEASKSIYDVEFNKIAIVIGNEANGVSQEVLDLADTKMIIPMPGRTESLNASVATGILIYEYVRNHVKNN